MSHQLDNKQCLCHSVEFFWYEDRPWWTGTGFTDFAKLRLIK